MQVVTPDLIKDKIVLLRYDIDAEIENGRVVEDFKIRAGLETLKLCLENADKVIMMGHISRPEGKVVPELSVEPIYDWLSQNGFQQNLQSGKLKLLENLRFEAGEDEADPEYAKKLSEFGNFYVNEAFSAHHQAASTTVLPTLLPHSAGLHFAQEVEALLNIKQSPKRPLVAIIGGVKIEDKYPAVLELSRICDKVLVGGLLAKNIREQHLEIPDNVVLAHLSENGLDLQSHTLSEFAHVLANSKQVIWSGPVGKYEDQNGNAGNKLIANLILNLNLHGVVGGGDTIATLATLKLLDKFTEKDSPVLVSVGGGAMLKLLINGTLPTIKVLE